MTSTTRIRFLWGILAALAMLGALAASTPYLINSSLVKSQISKQISDWLGLPVAVRGKPVVTVFPYLTVKLKDVQVASSLGADQPPLVEMETLRAEMYWLPLLLGEFEVRRFHLVSPRFSIEMQKDGNSSWAPKSGGLFADLDKKGSVALSDINLGHFTISNGQVNYINEKTGHDEQLSDVNLAMTWPSTGREASISGGLIWRGENVSIAAKSEKPMELIKGGLSPLSLTLSSQHFEAQLDGTAATVADLQLEGDFSFKTQSMRFLLDWLGLPLKRSTTLGAASMKARAHVVGASAAFSDMTLMLDNNSADGVLQLDFRRDRALLQGTLAYDALDLSGYMERVEGQPRWFEQEVSPHDLSHMDIDIRLSANSIKLGSVNIGRTAASLVTRNSQLSLSVSEAFAYGGRIEASLEMEPSKTDPKCLASHLRGKASGILAGTFAREISKQPYVSGTALAELDLQGEGKSLSASLVNASGDVSVVITDGALSHFNLAIMRDALDLGEEIEPDALYEGGTKFDVLSIVGTLGEKQAKIDGLRLTAGKLDIAGSAAVNLANFELNFPGILSQYRSADPSTHSTEKPQSSFPFRLIGPIGEPNLAQDIDKKPLTDQQGAVSVPGVPAAAPQAVPQTQPAVAQPKPEEKPQQTRDEEKAPLTVQEQGSILGGAAQKVLEDTGLLGVSGQ